MHEVSNPITRTLKLMNPHFYSNVLLQIETNPNSCGHLGYHGGTPRYPQIIGPWASEKLMTTMNMAQQQ
jgi:hypothetical protein